MSPTEATWLLDWAEKEANTPPDQILAGSSSPSTVLRFPKAPLSNDPFETEVTAARPHGPTSDLSGAGDADACMATLLSSDRLTRFVFNLSSL